MDNPAIVGSLASQVERIIRKLALVQQGPERQRDPEVAPLFPGYEFGPRLVAGITPIERGGPLDTVIERSRGMRGWIINLTVKGQGRIFDGVRSWQVGPGDLALFPPGLLHHYERDPDAESWWHRWIFFQPRAFWAGWLSWRDSQNGIFVQRNVDQGLVAELDDLFAEVVGWSAQADPVSIELAMNLLERIILLCSKQNQIGSALDADFDERLLVAVKFLNENLHRSLSVKEVAQHACLSPSRLAHLFSAKLGKSIVQWRDEQRVQFACQYLQVTNDPIKEIAIHIGYEDPLYFSRVFRKHMGLSPTEYRNRKCAP
ncbi:MAG: arabinose operon transcriptional regulator AraC [Azospirillaceae bacterium]|nr:arabinose operon transcriptional regulator AraC [Azospirillaceae bacterium]